MSGPEFTRYAAQQGLPDDAVRALCLDGSGRLWVGTLAGGLAVQSGERFEPFARDSVGAAFVRDLGWSAERGELWAATDRGAARIAGEKVEWMASGAPGLSSADLLAVVADVGGRTWLMPMDTSYSAPSAVVAWDGRALQPLAWPEGEPRRWSVLGVVQAPELPSLPELSGATLLVAEQGLLRVRDGRLEPVALEGTPLYRPTPRGRNEEEESRRLPPVYLQAVHRAKDGTLWFVHPKAIVSLGAQGWQERSVPGGWPLGPWAVEQEDGTLWFAAFDSRALRFAPGAAGPEVVSLKLEERETVDRLAAARDGVWIATRGQRTGLLRVRGTPPAAERVLSPADAHAPISANELLEDRQGALWLAGDDGLYRFAPR